MAGPPRRAAPKKRPPARRAPRPAPAPRPRRRAGPTLGPQRLTRQPAPVPRSLDWAFNGFDKRHLPLDDFTAPYTVSNFVSTLEFTSLETVDQVVVIAPYKYDYGSGGTFGYITDYICIAYDGASILGSGTTPPALHSVRSPIIGTPAREAGVTAADVRARLHNLSVKVQCLGTNSGLYPPGLVYYGTLPSIESGIAYNDPGIGGTHLTLWDSWVTNSVSVGYLKGVPANRLMSGTDLPDKGELGVIHATVCETIGYKTWRQFLNPGTATPVQEFAIMNGLEPIVVGVPRCGTNNTAVNYRIVIGQQWCSRHPNHPMLRATQKQHNATPPALWHKALSGVKSGLAAAGNKVAQGVSETALEALGRSLTRLMRPQAAIAGPPVVD